MEHRFRRKWFENTTFCIAVVKLACTEIMIGFLFAENYPCIYTKVVENK